MKKSIIIVVGLLFLFLCFYVHYLDNKLQNAYSKNAELRSDLQSSIEVNNNLMKYTYRDSSGTAKQVTVYVPHSGKVQIVTPKELSIYTPSVTDKIFNKIIQTDNGYILVKNKGFVFTPMAGVFYNGELDASLNLELLFYDRYGAGAFISYGKTIGIYISRNISDIIPFLQNSGIMINYGRDIDDQTNKFGLGLAIYL